MHPSNETLNDYVDKALTPAAFAEVQGHLQTCADCALVVAELQHIVEQAGSLPPVDPPAHIWARIRMHVENPVPLDEPAENREAQQPSVPPSSSRVTTSSSWGVFDSSRWALATAALIVLAFLAGRFIPRTERPQTALVPPAAQSVQAAGNVRDRVLLVAVGDHLERSQMVLVELANAQTRGELDISAERQSADELLASNRLYRQTAAEIGDTNVADVLDDLERVLVEVARGPSELSMQQLADIQQRIEAQGILFKVKIVGSEMRERGNSSIAARKQPVS